MFLSFHTRLAKKRTIKDKRRQNTTNKHNMQSNKFDVSLSLSFFSACLYLSLATLSRSSCSRLSLDFSSFNCQGPALLGITEQGRQWGKKTKIHDNTSEEDDHQMGREEKKEFKFGKGELIVKSRVSYEVKNVFLPCLNLDPRSSRFFSHTLELERHNVSSIPG